MKNILIGQSGGPTAVINASLYGAIKQAEKTGNKIYGMINGIEGFLNKRVIDLTDYFIKENIELLKSTPASFLGSCRYKLPEDFENEIYSILFNRLELMHIDAVLYIGGNDSMDTVDKLSKYAAKINSRIRFIGVPKTIDNDPANTDHTPGFGSTAKFVATTVRNIVWDAGVYEHPVVTIIELMGRNAGWVTASSVLARTSFERNPILIYLPESDFCMVNFLTDVKDALTLHSSVVVCVSEGIKDSYGKYICEYSADNTVDQFGHRMLTGCGKVLEQYIKRTIGCKCRSIEVNLPQRCSGTMISLTDITEAKNAGIVAINSALAGETGKMVSFVRNKNSYEIRYELVPVNLVCNKEKKFTKEWIVNGNNIATGFIDYVLPLIQGEIDIRYNDGLPQLLKPAYIEQNGDNLLSL